MDGAEGAEGAVLIAREKIFIFLAIGNNSM